MRELSPNERGRMQAALQGLDFPAPRNKLVSTALQNGAGHDVLDILLALPETADFHDAGQLKAALGVDVPEAHPSGGWE